MRILGWFVGALVFGVIGAYSIVATCVGLACMFIGVYELTRAESASAEVEHQKRLAVWVNGSVVNSGLTEEEADVVADAYLNAGFFDVETGEQ
jgi:hypothetical protein